MYTLTAIPATPLKNPAFRFCRSARDGSTVRIQKAGPCCGSMKRVYVADPQSRSMLRIHKAGPCCGSTKQVRYTLYPIIHHIYIYIYIYILSICIVNVPIKCRQLKVFHMLVLASTQVNKSNGCASSAEI